MKKKLALVFLLFPTLVYAADASFDCAKASTKTEKQICSRSDLSELDREIARLYKRALGVAQRSSEKVKIRQNQRAWLKKRDAACCSTPQLVKYPNLKQSMEMRVLHLHTFVSSPGIRIPKGVKAKHSYNFELLDDIDLELVPKTVFQYLNIKADEFLQKPERFADRYSGFTPEIFNRLKPMSFYYGPAHFHGVMPGEKRHCDYVWELRISLDNWRIYLLEYFDPAGYRLAIPEDGMEVFPPWLNQCEKSDSGLELVFWTNLDPRAAEMKQAKYSRFLYHSSNRTMIKLKD